MAESEIKTPWDFGESISVPFQLPNKFGWRIIIWAAALMMVITAVMFLLAIPIIKGVIPTFIEIANAPDSPDAIFAVMGAYMKFAGLFSVAGLASLLVLSSAEASMLAAYLRGDMKQGFPLRFDGDMWRVIGARLLVGLLIGAALFAIYIVLIILIISMSMATGSVNGSAGAMAFMGIVSFVLIVAAIAVAIFVSVRLSSVAAVSVRDRSFNLGDGWCVSKGRVWPMIGGFVILFIILGIAQNVLMYGGVFSVAGASGLFSMGEQFASMETPAEAFELIGSMFNPLVIILASVVLILLTVLGVVGRLCIAGVPAHVVKLDAGPEQIADIF